MKHQHYLADLHTHLNEKNIDARDWWDGVKKRKLSVIAITEHTEHDSRNAYEKVLALKPDNIILIPGMEAKTSAGHVIILGEDISIYDIPRLQVHNVPIEEALQIVNDNNLVASFAHPYGYKTDATCSVLGEKKSLQLLKKYKVGAEYYNGMLGSANNFVFGTQWIKKIYNFFDFSSKSKFGKALGIQNRSLRIKNRLEEISEETFKRVKGGIEFSQKASFITVGSDAHYPRTIGTAVLELKRKPKNAKDFLQMLTRKQILWAGPNIYSDLPVDKLKKKELLEGLKYVTKNRIKKKITKGKKKSTKTKIKGKVKIISKIKRRNKK
ncbi:MAG: hypothetical protein HOC95_01150 [Candidatus Diapherotrites archaeon]|nr:hypothetical protein [Candidatus Diapherotrites archaeon]